MASLIANFTNIQTDATKPVSICFSLLSKSSTMLLWASPTFVLWFRTSNFLRNSAPHLPHETFPAWLCHWWISAHSDCVAWWSCCWRAFPSSSWPNWAWSKLFKILWNVLIGPRNCLWDLAWFSYYSLLFLKIISSSCLGWNQFRKLPFVYSDHIRNRERGNWERGKLKSKYPSVWFLAIWSKDIWSKCHYYWYTLNIFRT